MDRALIKNSRKVQITQARACVQARATVNVEMILIN